VIQKSARERLLASTMIGGAFALAVGAAPAFAQDMTRDAERPAEAEAEIAAQDANRDEANEVSEVTVTGSRIRRQDYQANSPIVTVGQEALQSTGSATVETLLNDLPQFVPSVGNTSNNPSGGGQAFVELRGLGTQRTLVLLDGRRVIGGTASGVVDINLVPAAIIQNIEVITGGASAAYGSDAIAGVVNFRLIDDFEGVELDVQYGQTQRNDGVQASASLTVGGNFDEGKGNAVLSFGYSQRGEIFNADRQFSSISGQSGTSPLGSTLFFSANLPSQAAINAVFGTTPTTITPANLAANQIGYNPNDTLFYYPLRRNYAGPTTIDYTGFQPNFAYNTGALNYLFLPLERYNFFSRGSYEINDNAEVFGQFVFANYTATTTLAPTPAAGNPAAPGGTGFLVPVTNPFIPAQLKTLLASRTGDTANVNGAGANEDFLVNKRFSALGGRVSTNSNNVYQGLVGLRGDLTNEFSYEVYAAYGRNEITEIQEGNISKSAVNQLLQSPSGGANLCAGGFDPFGITELSNACASFIGRTSKNTEFIEQRLVEAVLTGPLFTLPAGEVNIALGADYRADTYSFVPDALLSTGDVAGFNAQQPIEGTVDVYELFGEADLPILANLPFVNELSLNLGYRYSQYSSVGQVHSYKAELNYEIIDPLRLRASYQRAVRAPSIGELFSPQNQSFPGIGVPTTTGTGGDPCDTRGAFRLGNKGGSAAAVRALCLAQGVPTAAIDTYEFNQNQVASITGGNPNLEEETATTYAVGLVFRPKFASPLLERFSASVDYYNIEIIDVISTIGASTQISACFNANGENPTLSPTNFFCTLFGRDPATGNITNPTLTNANLAVLETAGIDVQVDYGFDLDAIGLDPRFGSIDFNLVVSYLENYTETDLPGAIPEELKETVEAFTLGTAFPEYKILAGATYRVGPVDLGIRYRYVSELRNFDNPAEQLEGTQYLDLNTRYEVNDNLEFRAGINNLTDQQPRFLTAGQANTDPSTYDVLGRRYYIGLTASF
jgi:outer membrane receptor protein involved in Fe transport